MEAQQLIVSSTTPFNRLGIANRACSMRVHDLSTYLFMLFEPIPHMPLDNERGGRMAFHLPFQQRGIGS